MQFEYTRCNCEKEIYVFPYEKARATESAKRCRHRKIRISQFLWIACNILPVKICSAINIGGRYELDTPNLIQTQVSTSYSYFFFAEISYSCNFMTWSSFQLFIRLLILFELMKGALKEMQSFFVVKLLFCRHLQGNLVIGFIWNLIFGQFFRYGNWDKIVINE